MKAEKALADLKKELKGIGFSVKTNRNSLGRFGRLIHIETKRETGIGSVFTPETLEFWRPAIDLVSDFQVFDKGEKIRFA